MEAGPLLHPVALELPPGVDCDINIYLTSDSTAKNARYQFMGVLKLAHSEAILEEAAKMVRSRDLTEIAPDWRLMTDTEVRAYRNAAIEEARRASEDHPKDAGFPDAPG